MRTKIVAVTVGEHYYLSGQFCVKYLGIGKRLDSTRFWYVKQSDCPFDSEISAGGFALSKSHKMKVPFFFNVKHGQVITQKQIDELQKYDVIV